MHAHTTIEICHSHFTRCFIVAVWWVHELVHLQLPHHPPLLHTSHHHPPLLHTSLLHTSNHHPQLLNSHYNYYKIHFFMLYSLTHLTHSTPSTPHTHTSHTPLPHTPHTHTSHTPLPHIPHTPLPYTLHSLAHSTPSHPLLSLILHSFPAFPPHTPPSLWTLFTHSLLTLPPPLRPNCWELEGSSAARPHQYGSRTQGPSCPCHQTQDTRVHPQEIWADVSFVEVGRERDGRYLSIFVRFLSVTCNSIFWGPLPTVEHVGGNSLLL